MVDLLQIWWVWLSAALLLALIELVVPASVFLGFALGALVMAGIVGLTALSQPSALLALFAALSLLAWIVLRRVFRRQGSAPRIITRDINDT